MKNIFRLQHWQIFVIWIAPNLLRQFFQPKINHGIEVISDLINHILYLIWLWIITVEIGKMGQVRINNFFRVSFFLTVIYLPYTQFSTIKYRAENIGLDWTTLDWTRFFSHILLFIGLIMSAGFCAKVIKSSESGERSGFGGYVLYAILILLFPIGIWVMQPKVQKMLKPQKS
jgi:hypothetical protein